MFKFYKNLPPQYFALFYNKKLKIKKNENCKINKATATLFVAGSIKL